MEPAIIVWAIILSLLALVTSFVSGWYSRTIEVQDKNRQCLNEGLDKIKTHEGRMAYLQAHEDILLASQDDKPRLFSR